MVEGSELMGEMVKRGNSGESGEFGDSVPASAEFELVLVNP
jgi:hypothetical protein